MAGHRRPDHRHPPRAQTGAPDARRLAVSARARRSRVLAAVAALASVSLVPTTAAAAAEPRAGGGGAPHRGGSVTIGLEAETPGGWCLPQSQLATSGRQVAGGIYDTLTTVNARGQFVPYLAESVTPNATYDQWTITLRDGVKFHDGTSLDAAAVKLNLDSFRGLNPKLPARLSPFSFANVSDVQVVD